MLAKIILITAIFATISPAVVNENIRVGNDNRNMLVHVPSNLGTNRPLLISMHGMNQDPPYQQSMANWENIADTAKFVVVYPNGVNKSWDLGGDRDINFILAIIDTMSQRHDIDRARVYLSGFSMGGMMTYHAMGKIADKIAAFAPVSGYPMHGSNFTSSRPVPLIHVHGTSDDVVVYSGVDKIVNGWRNRNNCPKTGTSTTPYPPNKPNSRSKLDYWGPCDENTAVALLTLDGKGHWHSNDGAAGVHTSLEIWDFVSQYSLDGSTIVVVPNERDSIFNGDFATGAAGWTLNVWAGDAQGSVKDEEYQVAIQEIGTEKYQIQLIQAGLRLEREQWYQIAFDAYALAPRSIEVNVEQHDSPWKSYLQEVEEFALGTSKTTHAFKFLMSAETDKNSRLSFNLGGETGTVYIDNVVLSKTEAPTALKGSLATKKINYHSHAIHISPELMSEIKTVEVFSTNGKLVAKYSANEFNSTVDISHLHRGIYIVKCRLNNAKSSTLVINHFDN